MDFFLLGNHTLGNYILGNFTLGNPRHPPPKKSLKIDTKLFYTDSFCSFFDIFHLCQEDIVSALYQVVLDMAPVFGSL